LYETEKVIYFSTALSYVATRFFNVRLLHAVAFLKLLHMLVDSNQINYSEKATTLSKRMSQRSFNELL